VADDLGMAALALEVLVALERAEVPLQRDVILAWTGDEESGGEGIRYLLEHRRSSIDAEIALNEGGNPVLDEQGQVKLLSMQTAEKIYQDFEIVAKGATGHSSVPLADNAIFRLAGGLERLSRHAFPARLLPVTRAYLEKRSTVEPTEIAEAMGALAGAEGDLPAKALQTLETSPVMRALLRTTCVATLVSGGTRVNALPSEARANVNCRILPDEKPEELQRKLESALGDAALEVKPVEDFGRGGSSPIEGSVPEALRKVAAEMWPEAPVIPTMSLGATDSRFLRSAGVAAYGINPIANTEADARRAHGVDERIPVGSLRAGVELLHRIVLELAAAR
jgi:acetylornithine deacetylase/succinyl-diaminopimelate desuccinylase-like protein